jgi:hypothetical protein
LRLEIGDWSVGDFLSHDITISHSLDLSISFTFRIQRKKKRGREHVTVPRPRGVALNVGQVNHSSAALNGDS